MRSCSSPPEPGPKGANQEKPIPLIRTSAHQVEADENADGPRCLYKLFFRGMYRINSVEGLCDRDLLIRHTLRCSSSRIGNKADLPPSLTQALSTGKRASPNTRSRAWSVEPILSSCRCDTCASMTWMGGRTAASTAFRRLNLWRPVRPRLGGAKSSSGFGPGNNRRPTRRPRRKRRPKRRPEAGRGEQRRKTAGARRGRSGHHGLSPAHARCMSPTAHVSYKSA
jgi:hypothetical protein